MMAGPPTGSSALVVCFALAVDRRNRFYVDGDRPAIIAAERRRALHHLGHPGADEVEIRRLTGLQQVGNVLDGPLADPGLGIGGDVRRLLPVRALRVAGKRSAALEPAQDIPRRMAFFAMHDGFGQIAAAVPLGALALDGCERTRREEQRPPEHLQEAPTERRLDVMRLVRLGYGGPRLQISIEIG